MRNNRFHSLSAIPMPGPSTSKRIKALPGSCPTPRRRLGRCTKFLIAGTIVPKTQVSILPMKRQFANVAFDKQPMEVSDDNYNHQ